MLAQLKKTALRLLVLTLCLALAFTVAMVAVFSLPDGKINANALESAKIIEDEGNGQLQVLMPSGPFGAANITDTIMIIIANGDSIHDYPKYFGERKSGIFGDQPLNFASAFSQWLDIANCKDFAEGRDSDSALHKSMAPSYARYWHGYAVLLRPLLMLGNLGFIRNLNFIVMLFCFALLVLMMGKRFHVSVTVIFTLAFAAVQAFLVPFSMAYFVTFFLGALLSIIMLKKYERIKEKQWEISFFFIAGALTAFTDFLTTPLLTLLIPLAFYFLLELQSRETSPKNSIIVLTKSVLGWGLGYLLLWLAKWIIASLVFGQNVFGNAFSSFTERAGTSPSFSPGAADIDMGTLENRLGAIGKNLIYLINNPYILAALFIAVFAFTGVLVYRNIRKQNKDAQFFLNALPLAAIAIAPFVWYFLLSNHSTYHDHMTYRSLASTIFAVGLLLLYLYRGEIPAGVMIKAVEAPPIELPDETGQTTKAEPLKMPAAASPKKPAPNKNKSKKKKKKR